MSDNPYLRYDKTTLINFYESNEREIKRLEAEVNDIEQRQSLILEARFELVIQKGIDSD